jgi:tetratricopeptide (TPR) repeat protein
MRENMKTRIRSVSVVAVLLVIGLSGATAGCGKYSIRNLKAMKAFKDANDHYRGQRWKEAAARYEDMVRANPDYNATPDFTAVYFFLGNSYDNLWKPARKGEPENDAYMQKAIENYTKAAQLATNPVIKRRALEYLVAAYGSDKLNDPSQAEPVVQKMIQMDPGDPGAYFALSRIYQDSGRYEEAEQTLLKARDAKPNDPSVYNALGQFYNTQGEFEKTIEAYAKVAELDPNNPQSFHLIGGYYQDKASKDFRLTPAQKKDYNEKGIEAEDKALKLNPNYIDALVYKGILLRQLAFFEKDPAKQKEMINDAEQLRNKAMQLQKSGAASPGASGAKPAAGASGAKPTGK